MKDPFDNEVFHELKKELDKIGFTKKDMKEFEELEKELDNISKVALKEVEEIFNLK